MTPRWFAETPLAERMRPGNLDEVAGQAHLIGEGAPLRRIIDSGVLPSCILYGPPGTGKTTLARLMARLTDRDILEINAVSAKVAELRDLLKESERLKAFRSGRSAVSFVDEIYHFNRTQQNVLLPSVERGDIVLVGATTENPWFEINKTLLSRMMVFELHPLQTDDLVKLLHAALRDEKRGLGGLDVAFEDEALRRIALTAGGDARQALGRLEFVAMAALGLEKKVTEEFALKTLPAAAIRHDKSADDHYAVISALIKSIRGSDPDAAIYWLSRLLVAGEDLRFICRRLLISAAEDIGLADPHALVVASSAAGAVDMTGMPEARIILAEAVIYLAAAPKSNSAYLAVDRAMKSIAQGNLQSVPYHLRPGGEGYEYPHDSPGHWVSQQYMTEQARFYYPGELGAEKDMLDRLKRYWRRFSTP
ncbi:MAG: replication-associated recombination protein A [Synergistota bacterium]|nr:replication-associated recombination protein A [Synergistota bacterium]